jgi:hypothetical protein
MQDTLRIVREGPCPCLNTHVRTADMSSKNSF